MVPRQELVAERAHRKREIGAISAEKQRISAEKEHLAAQLSGLEPLAREAKEAKKRAQALKTMVSHYEVELEAGKRRLHGTGPGEDEARADGSGLTPTLKGQDETGRGPG